MKRESQNRNEENLGNKSTEKTTYRCLFEIAKTHDYRKIIVKVSHPIQGLEKKYISRAELGH